MSAGSQRLLGWLAVGSVVYHAVAIVSLHVLVPEVSPLTGMVGDYLVGPHQILSRTTFLAFGCAFAAVAIGLQPSLRRGLWTWIATALMTLAVFGFLGVALFPGAVNRFAILVRPASVLGIVIFSFILRRKPRWEALGTPLVILALLFVGVFVVTFALLIDLGLGGLANRLVLLLIYSWIVLVGRGLIGPAPQVA